MPKSSKFGHLLCLKHTSCLSIHGPIFSGTLAEVTKCKAGAAYSNHLCIWHYSAFSGARFTVRREQGIQRN